MVLFSAPQETDMTTPARVWEPTGGRASGRTHRALEALHDGGVFVVHSLRFKPHVEHILHNQGRAHDAVQVVPATNPDALRGLNKPVAVDHFVFEDENIPRATVTEIILLAQRANLLAAAH
jgi:hypothetical protein